MLLLAIIYYLHYEAASEEQNFPMIMGMIHAGEVREDEGFKSTLEGCLREAKENSISQYVIADSNGEVIHHTIEP